MTDDTYDREYGPSDELHIHRLWKKVSVFVIRSAAKFQRDNGALSAFFPRLEFTERRVALADELHVVRNVGSIRYPPGGAARRVAQRIVFPVAHQERRHCIERTIQHAGDKLLCTFFLISSLKIILCFKRGER